MHRRRSATESNGWVFWGITHLHQPLKYSENSPWESLSVTLLAFNSLKSTENFTNWNKFWYSLNSLVIAFILCQEFNSLRNLNLEIVKPLEKKLVVSKESELKLEVKVNCEKLLIFGWFKNGVLIDENTEKMKTFFENGTYSLVIDQPNIDMCNGVFSFAVKNIKDNSFKSCSSFVTITGK